VLQFSTVMFFVWCGALLVAGWAAEVARMFAKRVNNAATRPLPDYQPRVALILPIKDVDEDTVENIKALLHQNYTDYRLLCAVESEDDPVVAVLEELAREDGTGRLEIVIAGMAMDRGQKIHNQLAAVAQTTEQDEILAFVDADAQTGPDWLRALVGPLRVEEVGATTGYRFYVPTGPHAANAMVSVINASVAALLGPTRRNLLWGGSMAIPRARFFSFGVYDAWQNALSDDYVMSVCVKMKARQIIEYVPKCLVASPATFDWKGFFVFACRQYRITRICIPWVWLMAVGGALLNLTGLVYSLAFWIMSLALGKPDHPLILMFITLYAAGVYRGSRFLAGGKEALPAHAAALEKIRFWFTWGFPAVMFVNLLALLGAAFGRKLVWRGVSYTMKGLTRTLVHRSAVPTARLTQACETASQK
jgi:ceramide glucosyltransferase